MKKYISEFIGTFALLFCATGAIISNDFSGGTITHLGLAMVSGLIVTAMIYALGDVSGAHINPAVSIAFWFSGRFPLRQVAPYIISQCTGAIAASLLLKFLFPLHQTLGATIPSIGTYESFIIEFILSFLLMFVIINVSTGAKEKGITAGLAIGFMVLLAVLFGGPLTGASLNPARSIAPALVSGELSNIWVYILAPTTGMLTSVLACRLIKGEECSATPDK